MLLLTGSWQPMFYLLAVVSLVLAAVSWKVIPETLTAERRQRGGLRQTGRAFLGLARDRVFAGYALTVAFAYASLFAYISASSFVLQDLYGLSATEFSLMFALNAAGMIVLGLLNARLVRRFDVRRLLIVGLVGSSLAAVVLLIVVGTPAGASLGAVGVLLPLFVVVATRGLVSANATVLGVQRAPTAGAASAVLGACMFGGGILVSPLLALGGDATAIPMATVVAGGAIAALAGHRGADPGCTQAGGRARRLGVGNPAHGRLGSPKHRAIKHLSASRLDQSAHQRHRGSTDLGDRRITGMTTVTND